MSNEKTAIDGTKFTLADMKAHTGKLTMELLQSIAGSGEFKGKSKSPLKNHARVVISLRCAHSIAGANKYEGTDFHLEADEDGEETFKEGKAVKAKKGEKLYNKDGSPVLSTKYCNGYMNANTRPDGGLWELAADSELLAGLIEVCKDAQSDILLGETDAKKAYTKKVKALLDIQLSNKEAGTRKRDYTVVENLWD